MGNLIIRSPVYAEIEHAITNVRDGEGQLDTGNVLRRTCEWAGAGACKAVCQLWGEYESSKDDDTAYALVDGALESRDCSDLNLLSAMGRLGLQADEVLMVGVTADSIGFADSLAAYKPSQNPYGWQELTGFNAFFARTNEVGALGRRLADCADINFEFKDHDGKTVFGFEHGTRTNMKGSSAYIFEKDGTKMSYTEYVLRNAVEHYGADAESVRIRLAAAIAAEDFIFTFADEEKLEMVLPGWQADGFARNSSNPRWVSGIQFNPGDIWTADTYGLIVRDIEEAMGRLGIPSDNLDKSDVLNASASGGIFSSYLRHRQDPKNVADTRDLYLTFPSRR